MYLGAEVSKMQPNGGNFWTMSEEKYTRSAVKNLEDILVSKGHRLPSNYNILLPSSYKSNLDISSELKADGVTEYQELVGVLS